MTAAPRCQHLGCSATPLPGHLLCREHDAAAEHLHVALPICGDVAFLIGELVEPTWAQGILPLRPGALMVLRTLGLVRRTSSDTYEPTAIGLELVEIYRREGYQPHPISGKKKQRETTWKP